MFKKTIKVLELPEVECIYFFYRYKYSTNTYKNNMKYISSIYVLYPYKVFIVIKM